MDRAGHAARAPTATHQLRPLERDHGTIVLRELGFAREKRDRRNDSVAGCLHLLERRLVARVRKHDARSHRGEVASRCPLFAVLQVSALSAAADWFEWHADAAERV